MAVFRILNLLKRPQLWRYVGFISSVIGVLCYALSSSFKHLCGEWNLLKIFLYGVVSFIVCTFMLFAKKWQLSCSLMLKAHVGFLMLMVTSVYAFFYDKAVKGKSDVLGLISCGAFAFMSFSLSRQIELGFEVDLLNFFLGCLTVQIMKINLMLAFVGALFGYFFILLRSSLDSQEQHIIGTITITDHVAVQVDAENRVDNTGFISGDVDHQQKLASLRESYTDPGSNSGFIYEDSNPQQESSTSLHKRKTESIKNSPTLDLEDHSWRRICAGCNTEISQGRFLNCMGAVWHPECFRCHACNLPITDYEFSMSSNRPYHKSCYREQHHPRCDVCKNFIPTNSAGLIEYRAHPFWQQKYCPSHERDGTSRCYSCERMEPRDTEYLSVDDGRKLCVECLDSAIMDTHECQPLYLDIQDFYEGLNMKVEQQIPMLLVERQALNDEAMDHDHLPETRGLCLFEEQTVTTILRGPIIGTAPTGYRIVDMITEPYRLIRRCEVTAILVLFGLSRLLTGSILAHEMMHAWLKLKGYPSMSPEVEEGICQVLAHMWLDSEIYSRSWDDGASSSSSSSSVSSKKGKLFEKKLGEFFKNQIESDTSTVHGDGFRMGNQAVLKYGLRRTLEHIQMTGRFPI